MNLLSENTSYFFIHFLTGFEVLKLHWGTWSPPKRSELIKMKDADMLSDTDSRLKSLIWIYKACCFDRHVMALSGMHRRVAERARELWKICGQKLPWLPPFPHLSELLSLCFALCVYKWVGGQRCMPSIENSFFFPQDFSSGGRFMWYGHIWHSVWLCIYSLIILYYGSWKCTEVSSKLIYKWETQCLA